MAIVIFYDIDEYELSTWAMTNCASFVSWLVYDNTEFYSFTSTDYTATWCLRYEFEFQDEQEAMLFQLRWQGQ